ncbi:MAG: hypothetical protein MUF49_01885 [Oculatellaceae cyanobacterium Prado106]|jgi:hypothetical protein|nr:hypothetical protein [Oculatellaceae cyanobacterium Prado106]
MRPFSHLLSQKRVRKFLIPLLCALAIVIFLQLLLGSRPVVQPVTSFQALKSIPATAQQVRTGFYPVNVYQLDLSSNTYYVDSYVWFRWRGAIDPIANLEFSNAVEEWGMTQQMGYEEPQKQPDGSLYQIMRVEGRFFQPFALSKYPLDEQRLGILIENSIHTAQELVYVADTEDSGFADTLSIQGWNINGWQVGSLLRQYDSQFGDQAASTDPYSIARFELLIDRPLSYFIWKLLLPLVIVLVSSWGALLLHPRYVDMRIEIPVTALLTTVFLQQSYSFALPEVGYLVLLDKIYALAYLLIIVALMEAIVTADWIKGETTEDYQRVMQLDRPFLVGQFLILVFGVLTLIFV